MGEDVGKEISYTAHLPHRLRTLTGTLFSIKDWKRAQCPRKGTKAMVYGISLGFNLVITINQLQLFYQHGS